MKLPAPRLLPPTIAVMALLLGARSVALVRAAVPAEATPAPIKPDAPKTATPAPAPTAEPPISDSERALLLDLRKRRAELDAREAAMAARDGVLAAAEARLTARVGEMAALQQKLESLDAARRDRDEANWRGLVKLYEDMKPRDAGAIFNDLDLPVLLPILDRMKEAKAAAIMAAMLPERARLATAELAQYRARANALPPTKTGGGG